ncbi:MAG: ATP-binding protein [Polyangiales bacterium]
MKLATRMTLAIGACALALLGGAGLAQLRNEEADLRRVATKETLLLARSLQTAFENALRDRQIEDVSETLSALSRVDRTVGIFVYDEDGQLVGVSEGAQPSAATVRVEQLARERIDPVIELTPEVVPPILRLGLRLRDETPTSSSAIVLEKPLTELQSDLEATRATIALTCLLFVIAVAGLTWLLTRRYVGSPLARMIRTMQRVRAGDLQIVPEAQTTDEVGETQKEFELLVSDLEQERRRADHELDARQRIERGLQSADKLITLGQLSAVMAHEIGSPLQILEGRARALRRHAEDAELTRRTADMLIEQTERITRIVGQMLFITRRRPAARTLIDAEASIRSVVALLEIEARRRQVSLGIERHGSCAVFADGDQLQQIALNLVRNALDASPRGGSVRVRLGDLAADGGDERDRWLVLEVHDQGAGIPDEVRKHLFEPFYTTKSETGGSGLGLSVVKSIVQQHAGRVEFPEQPAGCIARVMLPRREEVAVP